MMTKVLSFLSVVMVILIVILVLNDKDNDANGDDESLVVFVGGHLSLGVAGQLSTWREPALSTKTVDLQHIHNTCTTTQEHFPNKIWIGEQP